MLEFRVNNFIFILVSPIKGVIRFRRRVKLNFNNIDPLDILQKVGDVASELSLSLAFSSIDLIFFVLMLWCYIPNVYYVLQ